MVGLMGRSCGQNDRRVSDQGAEMGFRRIPEDTEKRVPDWSPQVETACPIGVSKRSLFGSRGPLFLKANVRACLLAAKDCRNNGRMINHLLIVRCLPATT